MGLLAGLVLWLPLRPLHRIRGLGWLWPQGFVDERTLVATTRHSHPNRDAYESGPIHLLDLSNGTCRSIVLPDDALAEERTWTDEELGEAFRTRWRFRDLQIVGESLVARMVLGDKDSRLFVLDGRTGEERSRIHLKGRTTTILGPDLWIRPREPIRAGATYERVEIATGRSVQTDVLASDINLLETEPSPDGRFVIEQNSSGFTVWTLPSGSTTSRPSLSSRSTSRKRRATSRQAPRTNFVFTITIVRCSPSPVTHPAPKISLASTPGCGEPTN